MSAPYKTEKERAEAVLKRLGAEPWVSASVYFWMVPFFEAVADRLERLQAQSDGLGLRLRNLEMKVEGKR